MCKCSECSLNARLKSCKNGGINVDDWVVDCLGCSMWKFVTGSPQLGNLHEKLHNICSRTGFMFCKEISHSVKFVGWRFNRKLKQSVQPSKRHPSTLLTNSLYVPAPLNTSQIPVPFTDCIKQKYENYLSLHFSWDAKIVSSLFLPFSSRVLHFLDLTETSAKASIQLQRSFGCNNFCWGISIRPRTCTDSSCIAEE